MAIIKLGIFILCLSLSVAQAATEIELAFKNNNFRRVTEIYKANRDKNFTPKEIILISNSLRRLGFYRQEIKMNLRLIKSRYMDQHRQLMKDIKYGNSIDSEAFPNGLKILYWNIVGAYEMIIKGYSKPSPLLDKDQKNFNSFYMLLSELEFRTGKADKKNDADGKLKYY